MVIEVRQKVEKNLQKHKDFCEERIWRWKNWR